MSRMALSAGYPQSGSLRGCGNPIRRSGDDVREPEGELDLEDYLALLRRRWRWLAGTVLVVVGLVALFTLTRDEVYRSRADIQILTEQNQGVFNVRDSELFRNGIAELQYMAGRQYADAVDEIAGYEVDFEASLRFVNSSERTDSAGLIRVQVDAPSAAQAEAGAEAAAEAYLEDRLDRIVRSFERRRANNISQRDALRDERSSLNQAVSAVTAAAEAAPNDAARTALEAERDLLAIENEPRVASLTSRIGRLNASISDNEALLATLAEPESTARLLNPANTPQQPVSPDVPRNIMISIVVGVVLGLILAVLRDLLDTRARDGAELAQLVDIPVMATIGEIRTQRSAPGRVRRYRDLSAEESSGYQVLLNSLWLSNVDDPLQSIVFTSDRPGVGKTQTVVNLAQAEAARGTRVLIIDTDFINPSVASRLDVGPGELGLADLLEGTAAIESVLLDTGVENLSVIDAHGASDAGELLRSDRLGGVLSDLYPIFDLVLIDSPPALSTSDSRLVSSQADAVVVVYDPAQSRREELQRTIDLLRSARANLIGLVANRSRASHPVYLSARDR
jgi:capsular exopolysaccharide synthesis family protein